MTTIQKQVILAIVMVLLSVIFWYFLKYAFYNGNLTLEIKYLMFGISVLWGISLCLTMLLIKNKVVLFGSFVLILILFGLFFNNEPFYYLIALIILFLAFWLASKKIKREEKIQTNLNFWRIWKRGLPIFITALILLVSLIYYFSPELMNKREVKINLPRNTFNVIIKPIEGLIKEKLPEGMALNSKVYNLLPSEQKKELNDKYGVIVEKNDTGYDVLYKLVEYQLNNIAGPYKKFIPFGLAIGLFITLKIVSIIYVALVILLSYLVLKLLIVLKFARTEIEKKEVETIKL